jgi:hypothetical protein
MDLHSFANKWFLFYYCALGLFLTAGGLYLVFKNNRAASFLQDTAQHEKPPRILIRILKYLALFTLPGLILAFFPFAIIELLFTLWSLLLVYIAGLRLLRWDQSRRLLKAKAQLLPSIIRRSGAIMVAVALAIFLLAYLVLTQTPPG